MLYNYDNYVIFDGVFNFYFSLVLYILAAGVF